MPMQFASDVRNRHCCPQCRNPVPIRKAEPNEESIVWTCEHCQTEMAGVLIQHAEKARSNGLSTVAKVEGLQRLERSVVPFGKSKQAKQDREAPVCLHETEISNALDASAARRANLQISSDGPPLLRKVVDHGNTAYQTELVESLLLSKQEQSAQMASLVEDVERGRTPDVALVEEVTRESLAKAVKDLDLFVRLGISPPETGYPSDHSLAVAMLSTSMGINLGWDESTISHMAMGCMVHDLGMLFVPSEIYQNDDPLNDESYDEILKHPFHTFDILEEDLEALGNVSRMVAYQIHERCNGTGYPRRRSRHGIHPAARVAGIADVFVALISPRPHRAPLSPYHAILHLLRGVRSGLFDGHSVRALLETISLFPVGSYVRLSDGRYGTVVRANRADYDKPMVQLWRDGNPNEAGAVLNLLEEKALIVSQVVTDLDALPG